MSRLGERNSSADSRRRTFSTRPSRTATRCWSSRRLRTKFSKGLASLLWPTSTPCRMTTRRLSAIASAANYRWARNSPPSPVTPGNATSIPSFSSSRQQVESRTSPLSSCAHHERSSAWSLWVLDGKGFELLGGFERFRFALLPSPCLHRAFAILRVVWLVPSAEGDHVRAFVPSARWQFNLVGSFASAGKRLVVGCGWARSSLVVWCLW